MLAPRWPAVAMLALGAFDRETNFLGQNLLEGVLPGQAVGTGGRAMNEPIGASDETLNRSIRRRKAH
jgi:hypothetical protein